MRITDSIRNKLVESIIDASYDAWGSVNMTAELDAIINTTTQTIVFAMVDYYGSNLKWQADAHDYFRSDTFAEHCELLKLDKEVVLKIVSNPDKFSLEYL